MIVSDLHITDTHLQVLKDTGFLYLECDDKENYIKLIYQEVIKMDKLVSIIFGLTGLNTALLYLLMTVVALKTF